MLSLAMPPGCKKKNAEAVREKGRVCILEQGRRERESGGKERKREKLILKWVGRKEKTKRRSLTCDFRIRHSSIFDFINFCPPPPPLPSPIFQHSLPRIPPSMFGNWCRNAWFVLIYVQWWTRLLFCRPHPPWSAVSMRIRWHIHMHACMSDMDLGFGLCIHA